MWKCLLLALAIVGFVPGLALAQVNLLDQITIPETLNNPHGFVIDSAHEDQFFDRGNLTSTGSGGMAHHVRQATAADYNPYGDLYTYGGYGYYMPGDFIPGSQPGRFATHEEFVAAEPNTLAQSSYQNFAGNELLFLIPSYLRNYSTSVSRNGNIITVEASRTFGAAITNVYIPEGWYDRRVGLGALEAGDYTLVLNQHDIHAFVPEDPYTYHFTGSLSFTVQAIPEPSSVILIGLGVVVAGGLCKRRQRKFASQS